METNRSLEERVRYLEERVLSLEKKLAMTRLETVDMVNRPKPSYKPTEEKTKQSIEWDKLIFQKTLPRLFIFVFIIGILWGFKAASDYGFLTNHVKVVLGYIVSAAMILFGYTLLKRSRNILGQVLIGGAIPVLMLTTFAMHQLYDLTGPTIAFILNMIWIGLGLFFTHTYKSQGIGIVSSIGGVFVPFLIESSAPNIPVFIFYETILYVLFICLALRHRYVALYYVSAIFLNISLFIFVLAVRIPENYDLIAITPILVQQIALLTGFLKTNIFIKRQAYTLFGSVILSSLWIDTILNHKESAILFGLIAALFGVCFYVYKNDQLRAPIFIANASIGALFVIQRLAHDLTFEVVIGVGLVYMFISKKYKSIFHAILGMISYVFAVGMIFEGGLDEWLSWEMLHWLVFLAATGYAIYFIGKTRVKDQKLLFNIGIPYFALLLLSFTALLAPLFTVTYNQEVEPIIMSLFWVGIAFAFMFVSKPLAIPQGKYVGAGILFFTLGKIILIDIYFVSVGVKAILFILLGIAGLLVSRAYYKKT